MVRGERLVTVAVFAVCAMIVIFSPVGRTPEFAIMVANRFSDLLQFRIYTQTRAEGQLTSV